MEINLAHNVCKYGGCNINKITHTHKKKCKLYVLKSPHSLMDSYLNLHMNACKPKFANYVKCCHL